MPVETREKMERISVPKSLKEKIQELAEKFEITPAEVIERIISEKGFDDIVDKASKVASLPNSDMKSLLLEMMYSKMIKQLASGDDIDLNKVLTYTMLSQQMLMQQLMMVQMIKEMSGNNGNSEVLQQFKDTLQSMTNALIEKERIRSESSRNMVDQMYSMFRSEIDNLRNEIFSYIQASDPVEKAKRAKEAMKMVQEWWDEFRDMLHGMPIGEEEKRELEQKGQGDILSILRQLEKVMVEGRKLMEQIKGAGEFVPRPEEPEPINSGGIMEIPEETEPQTVEINQPPEKEEDIYIPAPGEENESS